MAPRARNQSREKASRAGRQAACGPRRHGKSSRPGRSAVALLCAACCVRPCAASESPRTEAVAPSDASAPALPYFFFEHGGTGFDRHSEEWVAPHSGAIRVLIVAAGGGGGCCYGGGGGAGGVIDLPRYVVEKGAVYNVTVGRGGFGGADLGSASAEGGSVNIGGASGGDSCFHEVCAAGGGGGGGLGPSSEGLSGGSGGGGSEDSGGGEAFHRQSGMHAYTYYGNPGGTSLNGYGAGGGGSNGLGHATPMAGVPEIDLRLCGRGGVGISFSDVPAVNCGFNGCLDIYGSGGGGGSPGVEGPPCAGGQDGDGQGGVLSFDVSEAQGRDGAAGRGGGGGGGGYRRYESLTRTGGAGGAGGDGRVFVAYLSFEPTPAPAPAPTAAPTAAPLPTAAPSPAPFCEGSLFTWDAGFGGCSTYSADSGQRNHDRCGLDAENGTGLLASQVCPECGVCRERPCTYCHGTSYGPDRCEEVGGVCVDSQTNLYCEHPLASEPPLQSCPAPANCVGDYTDWNGGYGGCETYGAGGVNSFGCLLHSDPVSGLLAAQVCPQCRVCEASIWVDDGCPSEDDDMPDDVAGSYRSSLEAAAGVRCCVGNVSRGCTTFVADGGRHGCEARFTWVEAEAICTANSQRLCTREEIGELGTCCGLGGNCDSGPVWTSTPQSAADPFPESPRPPQTTPTMSPTPATSVNAGSGLPDFIITGNVTMWKAPFTGVVRLLIVGGGGGGGCCSGGGGGGGGVIDHPGLAVTEGSTYQIVVGEGGAGGREPSGTGENGDEGADTGQGRDGGASCFGDICVGGGGGGGGFLSRSGRAGGSGGGGASGAGAASGGPTLVPSAGSDDFDLWGHPGGAGRTLESGAGGAGAGGGGAGGFAEDAKDDFILGPICGDGGAGYDWCSKVTGEVLLAAAACDFLYAGGGGGGSSAETGAKTCVGGGGGGAGGIWSADVQHATGADGATSRGGGGGGGGLLMHPGGGFVIRAAGGGAGGAGVVAVAYLNVSAPVPTPSPTAPPAIPSTAPTSAPLPETTEAPAQGPTAAPLPDTTEVPPSSPAPTPARTSDPQTLDSALQEVAFLEEALVEGLIAKNTSNATASSFRVAAAAQVVTRSPGGATVEVLLPGTPAGAVAPASLLDMVGEDSAVLVVSVLNSTRLDLLVTDTVSEVASAVSVSLFSTSGRRIAVRGLQERVQVLIPTAPTGLQCAFFDEGLGDWSMEGVREASGGHDRLVCATEHLTLFAAIAAGAVLSFECSQARLLNAESYQELWDPDWVGTPAPIAIGSLLFALLAVLAMACTLDARDPRSGAWRVEYFLVVDAGDWEPPRPRLKQALSVSSVLDGMGQGLGEGVDDVMDSLLQYFIAARHFAEAFGQIFCPLCCGQGNLKCAALRVLARSAERQASAALLMHPKDAKFLTSQRTELELTPLGFLQSTNASNPGAGVGAVASSTWQSQGATAVTSPRDGESTVGGACTTAQTRASDNSQTTGAQTASSPSAEADSASAEVGPQADSLPRPGSSRSLDDGTPLPAREQLESLTAGKPESHATQAACTAPQGNVGPRLPETPFPARPHASDGAHTPLADAPLTSRSPAGVGAPPVRSTGAALVAPCALALGAESRAVSSATAESSWWSAQQKSVSPKVTLASLSMSGMLNQLRYNRINGMRKAFLQAREQHQRLHTSASPLLKATLLSFVVHSPVGMVFSHSIIFPRSMRALFFACELLGLLLVEITFFAATGGMLSKKAPEQCSEGCEDGCGWWFLGRFLVVGAVATVLAGIPLAILNGLRTRGLRHVPYRGSPEWRRQLRRWRRQDAFVWALGLGYCFFVLNYVALFSANVSRDDQLVWLLATTIALLEDLVIGPLIVAAGVPFAALALLRALSRSRNVSMSELCAPGGLDEAETRGVSRSEPARSGAGGPQESDALDGVRSA